MGVDLKALRKKNLELTKKDMKKATGKDHLTVQAISSIEELDKVINMLVKRLREWYELYNPEFSRSVYDNEKFAELVASGKTERAKDTMGVDFGEGEIEPMIKLAKEIESLYGLRASDEKYLESVMKEICPNMLALTGPLIGGKLLQHAGSLERLMKMPASTIQLLGAEKALFRHIRTGARPPKQGLLIQHPFVAEAKSKGKAARLLADKISMAVKIDYFKGVFIGDELKKYLEAHPK